MKKFTPEELEVFDLIYPNRTNEEIAKIFDIKVKSVKQKAMCRGLKKSDHFISETNRLNSIKKEKNPLLKFTREDENFKYMEIKNFANKIGYKNPSAAISELSEFGKYNGAIIFKKRFNEYKKSMQKQ